MNTITHWIDTDLAEVLGWTLLHSLWQGAAIALLLALGLTLAHSRPPAARYRLAYGAMLALLMACVATFSWLYSPSTLGASTAHEEVTLLYTDAQEAPSAGAVTATTEAVPDHPTAYRQYFEQHLPLLVTGWLLGVLLLSLRMLGEMAYIQHLKHYRCRGPKGIWPDKLSQLKEQMGIRRNVELRETHRIHSPMVVGVFKQVILLPAGLLSGLTPGQVEAILAHELAHVRRNDYLANLFISMIETLLFFNPMMWWISNKIRSEREHACDDLALEMTGDTLNLVRSLALLEERRLSGHSLAMAFMGKDGSVLNRIQRLLQRNDKRQVAAKAFWALSTFLVCLALLAFQAHTGQKPAPLSFEEKSVVEQPEPEPEPIMEAHNPAPAVEQEPAVVAEPSPQQPALPDTIPAGSQDIEKQLQQLEQELQASEMEMRKKEQSLRREELMIRKESQQAMQALQKAMLELELQMRSKEHEKEMLESEFEISQNELEAAQISLEEQHQNLELQEEELEKAEGQERQQKLKAFQKAQQELLEKQKALELRMFQAQKSLSQQSFEKDKALQELQNRRFQMEQDMQMKEQDMQLKMMNLHHKMEQMEASHRMMEKEAEAKARELEKKISAQEDREE